MTRADTTRVINWDERFAELTGMERAALGHASRGMTRADTTPVTSWEERFVDLIGMVRAALGGVPRAMTRAMDTSTVTRRETRSACPVGKGHPVTDA